MSPVWQSDLSTCRGFRWSAIFRLNVVTCVQLNPRAYWC